MADHLEELALSGRLFATSLSTSPPRSPSHSRSPSPDLSWPTKGGNSPDLGHLLSPTGQNADTATGGSMQTGVKGILRDHAEAVRLEQAKNAQHIKETNRRLEKMALNGRTFTEEEEERVREKQLQERRSAHAQELGRDRQRMSELTGRFAGIREVDEYNFLEEVDDAPSGTWVLIHIYDSTLARCHDLDSALAPLARQYPQTKFLRAHAGALGFLGSMYSREFTPESQSHLVTISEKESYSDDEDGAYLDEVEQEITDQEVLPTILAYRSGQLVHSWIRVDWEVEAWKKRGGQEKEAGSLTKDVEALLQGHFVIQPLGNGNCGFSSDDDDFDLRFARGDDVDDEELFDL